MMTKGLQIENAYPFLLSQAAPSSAHALKQSHCYGPLLHPVARGNGPSTDSIAVT